MHTCQVEIIPIKAQQGLVGFASVTIDKLLFIGSIGIHKRLNGQGFRITYPTRKAGDSHFSLCHPVSRELSKAIEKAVVEKAEKVLAHLT